MNWLQKILHPHEEIVFRSKAPESVILVPFVLMLILFFSGYHGVFFWLAVFFSLVGVFRYFYYEHIVTNKRIITKYGFFYLRYRELPIEKVDAVTCWRSFTDKLYGTGVVALFGIGITTRKIKRIAKAADFRNAIHSQLSTEPENYFDGN